MKKCPFCAEEIQDEAIVCRYCGRDLVTQNPPVTAPPPSKQSDVIVAKKTGLSGGCFGLGLIIAIIVIIILASQSSKPTVDDPYSDAWYACREFITRRLKAPKTADFQRYSAGSVIKVDADEYRTSIYVDSQNSFGALIRSNFDCYVLKEASQWKLITLTEN